MDDASLWDGRSSLLYAQYCDKHDTYSVTSSHLVDLVAQHCANPSRIVDLACGTGVTSLALKAKFGGKVTIIGIDRAEGMLDIARADPALADVRFVHAKAELMNEHVEPGVDAVLSNSAFWLMNMPAVLRNAASVLRPGGVFAFSCPGYLLSGPGGQAPLGDMPELMLSLAATARSLKPSASTGWDGSENYSLSEAAIGRMAHAAGFALADREALLTSETNQATYDAMQIPAILARYLPMVTAEKRAHVLRTVFEALVPLKENSVEWYSYILSKN